MLTRKNTKDFNIIVSNTLAKYIVENDLKNGNVFDIYNKWASENGIIIDNENDLTWVISYIKLLQTTDYDFLKEAMELANA